MAPITPSQVYELVAHALRPWAADEGQQGWIEYGVVTAVAQFVRCAETSTAPWPAIVHTIGKEAGVSYSQAAALAVRVFPDLLSHPVFRTQVMDLKPDTLTTWFAGWARHAAACWRAGWYPNMRRQTTAADLLTGGHSDLEPHFSAALSTARRKEDGRWFFSLLHRRSAKIGAPRNGESLPPRRAVALGMPATRQPSSPDLWIAAVVELAHAHGLDERAAELRHTLEAFAAVKGHQQVPQSEGVYSVRSEDATPAAAAPISQPDSGTAPADEPAAVLAAPPPPPAEAPASDAPAPVEATEPVPERQTAAAVVASRPPPEPLRIDQSDPVTTAAVHRPPTSLPRSHHVGPKRRSVRR